MKNQRGLTLIELLVTMVLLGFVVALMSGAFVQIAQMLRISSEHGNGFSGRWTQSRGLQDAVANMLPDPAYDIPLVGSSARMTFTTLALPPLADGVARLAKLILKTNAFAPDAQTITKEELLIDIARIIVLKVCHNTGIIRILAIFHSGELALIGSKGIPEPIYKGRQSNPDHSSSCKGIFRKNH